MEDTSGNEPFGSSNKKQPFTFSSTSTFTSSPTLPSYFQSTSDAEPASSFGKLQDVNSSSSSDSKPVGLFGAPMFNAPSVFSKMSLPSPSKLERTAEAAKGKDEAEPALTASLKSPTLKRSLSVDISQLRAIVVYEIPEDSNNKLELTKHFQLFGKVVRIFPNPKKQNATIHFESHVSCHIVTFVFKGV